MTHLLQLIENGANTYTRTKAINGLSYQYLATRINDIRRVTLANISRGDRVIVAFDDPFSMVTNTLAVMAHAICIPTTTQLLNETIDLVQADIVITDNGVTKIPRNKPHSELCTTDALILFTAGTTGKPKAVRLSHDAICASATAWASGMGLTKYDHCLYALPISHGTFIASVLATLTVGGSIECTYPIALAQTIKYNNPTWMPVSPKIIEELGNIHLPKTVRFLRTSKMSAQEAAAIEDRLEVPVIKAYGMTEAGSGPIAIGRHKTAIGRPIHLNIKIIENKEISVAGPSLMLGYLDKKNSPIDNEGWLRTGDKGYLDQDGFLYLEGRL